MIGSIIKKEDKSFERDNVKIFVKDLPKDYEIPRHNHPDNKIYFILIEGELELYLDQNEKHTLKSGEILEFDGNHTIEGKALKTSHAYVLMVENSKIDTNRLVTH